MLNKFKPTTPGLRGTVLVSKKHLSNEKPFKSLEEFKKHADKKAILRRGASQILKFYGIRTLFVIF